mmetsp:Transcript_14991/g.28212  ORF Transcript_14991/g.28212 Transcript_14991/m.28212 type:complete len:98 (+) Transcript_14991:118-411(+)
MGTFWNADFTCDWSLAWTFAFDDWLFYQGWMHRPTSVKTRFRWDLVSRDLVNGGMLTVIIVISFLSIMSLLDFFRVKWVREMARNEGGNLQEGNGGG